MVSAFERIFGPPHCFLLELLKGLYQWSENIEKSCSRSSFDEYHVRLIPHGATPETDDSLVPWTRRISSRVFQGQFFVARPRQGGVEVSQVGGPALRIDKARARLGAASWQTGGAWKLSKNLKVVNTIIYQFWIAAVQKWHLLRSYSTKVLKAEIQGWSSTSLHG